MVRMDVHKMSQVIRNLISNALKFTPERGRVIITLRLVGDLSPAPTATGSLASPAEEEVRNPLQNMAPKVRLEVEDTGPGISEVYT